jgi:RimJ/RimL family protein N-acetyltransferase
MGKGMKLRFQEYMIRNWKKGDALSISKYANNRKIWLNLRDGFPHPYSIENAKQFIGNAISKHPRTFFAITSSREAIGSIGISIGEDVHRYTAELGYWLAEPYWGKGIVTGAVSTITKYAFKKFKLERIYAEPYDTNTASSKVLEKAGFKFEGRLKANAYKDGKV